MNYIIDLLIDRIVEYLIDRIVEYLIVYSIYLWILVLIDFAEFI
jgi:hypothetical protein